MKHRHVVAAAVLWSLAIPTAAFAQFTISSATGMFSPSFRGGANTTYFGWDTFDDPSFAGFASDVVINDGTPDLGTYAGGSALIAGNSANDHVLGSGNLYTAGTPLDETVIAPTAGTVGTGFTTLIVQGITAFGPFAGPISFSSINGVAPSVAQGNNSAGAAQFWAKYELPGNQLTYPFTMTSIDFPISIAQLVVDTQWSPSGFAADTAIVPEPGAAGMFLAGAALLARRRSRQPKTGPVVPQSA